MTLMSQLEDLETMISGGRMLGTSRKLVNVEKVALMIAEIKDALPTQISEAEQVVRQKDAIIKQAELEGRRIRAYADEEATTIRQLAEEQANTRLSTSQEEANKMIEETEIHRFAMEKASGVEADAERRAKKIIGNAENQLNSILSEAETQADERRKGADNYAREVLFTLEERVADTLGQVRGGIDLLDARPAIRNVAD